MPASFFVERSLKNCIPFVIVLMIFHFLDHLSNVAFANIYYINGDINPDLENLYYIK